jgi:hypothetical protein
MSSVIFNGDQVKTLKDKIQIGPDNSTAPQIINVNVDPTLTNLDANPGSYK